MAFDDQQQRKYAALAAMAGEPSTDTNGDGAGVSDRIQEAEQSALAAASRQAAVPADYQARLDAEAQAPAARARDLIGASGGPVQGVIDAANALGQTGGQGIPAIYSSVHGASGGGGSSGSSAALDPRYSYDLNPGGYPQYGGYQTAGEAQAAILGQALMLRSQKEAEDRWNAAVAQNAASDAYSAWADAHPADLAYSAARSQMEAFNAANPQRAWNPDNTPAGPPAPFTTATGATVSEGTNQWDPSKSGGITMDPWARAFLESGANAIQPGTFAPPEKTYTNGPPPTPPPPPSQATPTWAQAAPISIVRAPAPALVEPLRPLPQASPAYGMLRGALDVGGLYKSGQYDPTTSDAYGLETLNRPASAVAEAMGIDPRIVAGTYTPQWAQGLAADEARGNNVYATQMAEYQERADNERRGFGPVTNTERDGTIEASIINDPGYQDGADEAEVLLADPSATLNDYKARLNAMDLSPAVVNKLLEDYGKQFVTSTYAQEQAATGG